MTTDFAFWRETALNPPPWDERNDLMARFLRPGDRILDFGAGAQTLRSRIYASCVYYPVDCVSELPDTLLIDFNSAFTMPETDANVAYLSGFLEYVDDLDVFFSSLSRTYPGIFSVFSYGHTRRHTRRWAGWTHEIGPNECQRFFERYFDPLRKVADFEISPLSKQSIFVGCLRRDL